MCVSSDWCDIKFLSFFRELFWVSGTYFFVNLFCSWFVLKLSKKSWVSNKKSSSSDRKKKCSNSDPKSRRSWTFSRTCPRPRILKTRFTTLQWRHYAHTHTREILFKTLGLFQMTSQVHKSYCLILIPDVTNTFTPIENWQLTKFYFIQIYFKS